MPLNGWNQKLQAVGNGGGAGAISYPAMAAALVKGYATAPFFSRGGKLLMYHGWADQQVAPLNSTTYFDAVVKESGKDAAGKSIALYLVPGMGHCQGGAGTDDASNFVCAAGR